MKTFLGLAFIATVMVLVIATATLIWYLSFTNSFSR